MKSALVASLLLLGQPQPVADVQCFRTCVASEAAADHTALFEGYSPFVYKDVAGYPTIGHGHLIKKGEKFREPMLPGEARALLIKDMKIAERAVNTSVAVKLWQEQFDALMSWTFNLGGGALRSSTMLKRINASLHQDVPAQMLRWNKAGGKVWRGLTIRREAEGKMYQKGTDRSLSPKK